MHNNECVARSQYRLQTLVSPQYAVSQDNSYFGEWFGLVDIQCRYVTSIQDLATLVIVNCDCGLKLPEQ